MIRTLSVIFFIATTVWGGEPRLFHPPGHSLEGLPVSADPQPVYADDPAHPLNRLHALLFLKSLIPEEVQAQLPDERAAAGTSDEAFFVKGWYFQKRTGTAADRKAFGGDVRVSPVRSFTDEKRSELLSLLERLSTRDKVEAVPELRDPRIRLLVQWDIASVWRAFERAESDDVELLVAMARAVAALAQPAQTLRRLDSGANDLQEAFAGGDLANRSAAYLPAGFPPAPKDAARGGGSAWVEVGRKSSALFQADKTLRASRVYIHAGSREKGEAIVEAVLRDTKEPLPEVPKGTRTALAQTLVGFDENLNPVATPVIDEVRIRVAREPFTLSPDNPSSSRDGSSHWIYLRTRYGSSRPEVPDFRFVPDTAQSMFIAYGSLKHAAYAAQCALCHRTTNAGGQAPAGIRVLSRYRDPHIAEADERPRLAEKEAQAVAALLRTRLRSMPVVAPRPERLPPRPEQTDAERTARAKRLRSIYTRPPESWPAPHVDQGIEWEEIGLLPEVEHPPENPYSQAKAELGKLLFFDPRLSGSGQIACASCHDPDLHWADGRTTSFGHSRNPLTRNAPSIRDTAFQEAFFWDGRAESLEDQAIQVLFNPDEMHADPETVVPTLVAIPGYPTAFQKAFDDNAITLERIAQAIACFERTITGGRSQFDAFLKGNETALSDEAILGLDLFRREARCMNCHHGSNFTDGEFHDVGLSYYGRKYEDLGRYGVTGNPDDVGRFRTPTLRDVTATAPYMHNGLFELPGVLNMYNAGMPTLRRKPEQQDDPLFPTKSPHLEPLGLNRRDLSDLAAFLEALEEPKRRIRPPELPSLHDEASETVSRP